MRLLALAGDGIGPEITAVTLSVLKAAAARFPLDLHIEEDIVGHASLVRYGTTVRPELLDTARAADGLILGPTATFDFKDPAKGEINVSPEGPQAAEIYVRLPSDSKKRKAFFDAVSKWNQSHQRTPVTDQGEKWMILRFMPFNRPQPM